MRMGGSSWREVTVPLPFPNPSRHPQDEAGPVPDHFARLARLKGNSNATVVTARELCRYLLWMFKEEGTQSLQSRLSQPLLEARPT